MPICFFSLGIFFWTWRWSRPSALGVSAPLPFCANIFSSVTPARDQSYFIFFPFHALKCPSRPNSFNCLRRLQERCTATIARSSTFFVFLIFHAVLFPLALSCFLLSFPL
ncbi:hypothetical protein CPC08DRAFT_382836 [Agrocybe pediades]|nr:hypothetical protein CPC08DRAFT_382836 [Agrocybe pediades]